MTDGTGHKTYERGRWHHLENRFTSLLTGAGLIPNTYLLTTIGRKSGEQRRNPVTIVQEGGRRWLVSPYGIVPWVLNVRVNDEVTLRRRGRERRFRVVPVSAEDARPVLKRYLAMSSVVRPYFRADRHAPVEDFAADAADHPVFELLPVDDVRVP
ncbi:nitroreductase family deazaflavin-dependent oxidoreductase [Rathayibacter sp. YIM 133350]|uniref:nitroreductase family deazaflavin-dependent oxidoreductase n=1 Tax=Rathayibacter sp. YIM 133350 TaxID=3131992 RepID=UPI00307CE779